VDKQSLALLPFVTSDQETKWVYSFNLEPTRHLGAGVCTGQIIVALADTIK